MKSLENKRVQNINYIMDDIHDSVNIIYESLMDEEFSPLKTEVQLLIKKLKSILESVNDEL
jgi:hypothetical protein